MNKRIAQAAIRATNDVMGKTIMTPPTEWIYVHVIQETPEQGGSIVRQGTEDHTIAGWERLQKQVDRLGGWIQTEYK